MTEGPARYKTAGDELRILCTHPNCREWFGSTTRHGVTDSTLSIRFHLAGFVFDARLHVWRLSNHAMRKYRAGQRPSSRRSPERSNGHATGPAQIRVMPALPLHRLVELLEARDPDPNDTAPVLSPEGAPGGMYAILTLPARLVCPRCGRAALIDFPSATP